MFGGGKNKNYKTKKLTHLKSSSKKNNRITIKKTKVDIDSCSPANQNNSTTCFDFEGLAKIAKGWNKKNPTDKIKIPSSKNRHQLWSEIDKRLKGKCDTEWCWIEQEFVKKMGRKELLGSFRPKMPSSWKKNKYEWLNTTDIESVMKQYEDKYHDFKFIGPVPIDFDYEYSVGKCIVNELCHLSIKKLIENKIKKVGIIYNLDPHDKPGSHWVAMYLDLNKKNVYYFDSYGTKPPTEVEKLIERIQEQGKELGFEIKYEYNMTRHQYQNSECGVYSIYFITQLLEGKKSFNNINTTRIKDEYVNSKRKYYYLS
jgi:hypothetical protein